MSQTTKHIFGFHEYITRRHGAFIYYYGICSGDPASDSLFYHYTEAQILYAVQKSAQIARCDTSGGCHRYIFTHS